jgi:hypothetical protein
MSENFSQYIEQRLNQWADWFGQDHYCGLGYPPFSMEYLLMTGATRSSKGSSDFISCNEEAEEIEELVKEMSEYNYNMAIAIRCHYFTDGGLRAKAKKVNVSHMHYKNYVDMAHQWLAGRLSAYNKKHSYQKNR